MGSDHDSVQSFVTPPAYEQIAPPLHQAEVKMVEGALSMKTKCAWDVYTPLRRIFAVPYDMQLDRGTMADIYSEGFSRVPVYEKLPPPNDHRLYAMRGILMTRQLIMIDWEDERPVSSLPLYYPPCISPRMNLVDVLQLLQKGGSHIAFVCAGPDLANEALENNEAIPIEAGFMGLVTLEDVLEAILQDRIYDEEDISDRDLASARLTQWAAKILQRFYRKRVLAKAQQQLQQKGSNVSVDDPTTLIQSQIPNPKQPTTKGNIAFAAALATSTQLASSQPKPKPEPSVPGEIDVDTPATEVTPLISSQVSSLSTGLRKEVKD